MDNAGTTIKSGCQIPHLFAELNPPQKEFVVSTAGSWLRER
jgi:hypothetical protein